jgi:hypothetical protein
MPSASAEEGGPRMADDGSRGAGTGPMLIKSSQKKMFSRFRPRKEPFASGFNGGRLPMLGDSWKPRTEPITPD